MIRPLRRRHLRLIAALALVGPVVFIVGLRSRMPVPVMETLPFGMAEPAVTGRVDTVRIGESWFALTIGRRPGTGEAALRLVPVRDSLSERADAAVAAPDVLVYWSEQPVDEALPEGAWLLGPLRGERPAAFRVPVSLEGADGFLVLYSLAHRQLLGGIAVTLALDRS